MIVRTALDPPASWARTRPPDATPLRVGLVQHAWDPDRAALTTSLREGIGACADHGAAVVFLPELTLVQYPAFVRAGAHPGTAAESLTSGPTFAMAASAARDHGVFVHASLFERHAEAEPRGYNTAILVNPAGDLVARTRKLHIPVTAGYYEDTYFEPGPSGDAYPVHRVDGLDAAIGLPTCWDEWFPEVARAYSLAGAEVLAYPTAIGSEPDHPDFDTQPLWRQVIVANGIVNGTFMVVPNRTGDEGAIRFYGSSFISDPYGRVLVEAPRDEPAALVADLDLDQRADWLELFPFLVTRRPDTYSALVAPRRPAADGPDCVGMQPLSERRDHQRPPE